MSERRPFQRYAAIFSAVLLFLVTAAALWAMGLRWYALRQMSGTTRLKIERFRTDPVHFPPEWAEVELSSTELLEDLTRLDRLIADFTSRHSVTALEETRTTGALLRRLQNGGTLATDEWTSLSLLAAAGRPLLEETSRVVALEGYELGAGEPDFSGRFEQTERLRTVARLACATALVDAREERWDEALGCMTLAFRILQRHPACEITTEYQALGPQVEFTLAAALQAWNCPEPEPLKRTLEALNVIRNRLRPVDSTHRDVAKLLGPIRNWKKLGFPIDIAPGRPMSYYFDEHDRGWREFPVWMLERLPASDPARAAYAEWAAPDSGDLNDRLQSAFIDTFIPEVWYSLVLDHSDSIEERQKFAQAGMDLLRLRIAQSIRKLEEKATLTSAAAYVPHYLPEEPMDPFSGKPYLWDAKDETFYSVGPDGVDDRLASLYNILERGSGGGDLLIPVGADED